MRASARTPWEYREIFGGDLIREMNSIKVDSYGLSADGWKTYEQLAWIMARDGGEPMAEGKTHKEQMELWLESFDSITAIYDAVVEIAKFWRENTTGTSIAKKN